MTVQDLPALNATLNAAAAVLLVTGYTLIRRGKREAHRYVMMAAFATSVCFLISYLVYHAQVGSVRFPGSGAVRALYLTILGTHTVLAAAVPVLAIVTLSRALKSRFAQHRKIARWTLPVWLYVSVTGVVVYWMLYRVRY
jgi:putative membrane protein